MADSAAFGDKEFEISRRPVRALNERARTILGGSCDDILSVPNIAIGIIAPIVNHAAVFNNNKFEVSWGSWIAFVAGLDKRRGAGSIACDDRSPIPNVAVGIVAPVVNEILPLGNDDFKVAWVAVGRLNQRTGAGSLIGDNLCPVPDIAV